jgi:hypothetical protein
MLKRRSGLPVGERADGRSYHAPTGIMPSLKRRAGLTKSR